MADEKVSLALPETTSFEEWRERGHKLARDKRRLQWALGDWWAFGERRYGDRRSELREWDLDLDYHSCENYAVVARAFVGSRRREALSFAHHEAVANLPPEEADRLLDWAEETIAERGRPRLRQELRDRAGRVRLDQWQYDPSPPRKELTIPLRVEKVTWGPRPTLTEPAEPTISLDDSAADNPVPEDLAKLAVEPPQPLDRVAIANEALAHLTLEEAREVIRCWLEKQDTTTQAAIRELFPA